MGQEPNKSSKPVCASNGPKAWNAPPVYRPQNQSVQRSAAVRSTAPPVYRPQRPVAQPKTGVLSGRPAHPAPPPVFRPQQVMAQPRPVWQAGVESRPAPPVYRPQASTQQLKPAPIMTQATHIRPLPAANHGPNRWQELRAIPAPVQMISPVLQRMLARRLWMRGQQGFAIQCKFTKKDFPRPNFKDSVYKYATMSHNVFQEDDLDPDSPGLSSINAAVPHRMSWADIRDNTIKYLNKEESKGDFLRWTQRFVTAGNEDKAILQKIADETSSFEEMDTCERIIKAIETGTEGFVAARSNLIDQVEANKKDSAVLPYARTFLYAFNSYYPNVPDLGQHRGLNIQVSNRPHSNIDEEGNKSPMTRQLWEMTPERLSEFPTDLSGNLVTTSGFVSMSVLDDDDLDMLGEVGSKQIKAKVTQYDKSTGWM